MIGLLFLLLEAGVALGSNSSRDSMQVPLNRDAWFENFDSYETGSALDGQGGWFCWDGLTVNTAYITDNQSLSPSNSLEIKWNDQTNWEDMVHAFTDISSGNWTIRAWLYVPADMTGSSDFILMNTYVNGSHTNNADWSLQLEFSASAGTIKDLNDATKTLPIVKDAWAQLRVSIDFEADLQTIYYNGQFLEHTSWKNHCAQGGAQNFAAIDLYAAQAYSTSVYWDELSVTPPAASPLSCDAGGPYNGNINEAIHFTGTADGGWAPYTWLWDFGDGSTSTEQNPTHAYTAIGTFDITLTAIDAIRDTASDSATATIVQTEPALQITSITGGLGISAVIKNTGTAAATNVQWTINCTGIVFPKTKGGSVTSLAAGSTATATAKVLGFGKTTITVTATCTEGKTAQKTATAKVFLFFVLGVA